jgi:hypothetical protein
MSVLNVPAVPKASLQTVIDLRGAMISKGIWELPEQGAPDEARLSGAELRRACTKELLCHLAWEFKAAIRKDGLCA